MKISNKVLENLSANKFLDEFEVGGIIGSKDGEIIDTIVFDEQKVYKRCTYVPNIEFLNSVIDEWRNENIDFKGVFHTHCFGIIELSNYDKSYIHEIMKKTPKEIRELFFPIFVIPQKELFVYKAVKEELKINIYEDKYFIL